MNLKQIVELVGGNLKGKETVEVSDARGIDNAHEGHITFIAEKKYLDRLKSSKASAVIADKDIATEKPLIVHPNPTLAFAKLLSHFHPAQRPDPYIDSHAVIADDAKLGKDVTVLPFVTIGKGSTIGDNVVLHPGVVIGDGCSIGKNTMLYPNVTLYRDTVVGNHVILHAGVVIGADGFGYTPDEEGRHYKINQVGRVVIEDHVEVGANTCIDRATQGDTVIKEGTKIDNLVQIAHNCEIGKHSIIVSQVGMAGSCKLGHHVVLAGQVGLADHVTLGDQVVLAAQSGTSKDIEDNAVYGGSPAVPAMAWKKYVSILPKLPELSRKIRELEKRLDKIEKS